MHEKVLEDCEIALRLNENNFRALYRKAKALNELGRYKKAYDAVAKCYLAVPQVGKLYMMVIFKDFRKHTYIKTVDGFGWLGFFSMQ